MADPQPGSTALTATIIRTLTDKLYEKRKSAALEIERMVKELGAQNQTSEIEAIVELLGDLAHSQNPNNRKGGLLGLAATAIALGNGLTQSYVSPLIRPVLECFSDADSRTRYYACEALYNIIKVARDAILPHFAVLFDTLCTLAADTDQNVRNATEKLDELLKSIALSNESFSLPEFVALLQERIYTKNPSTRLFLIGWVKAVTKSPKYILVKYLPDILDGFFQIQTDHTPKIRELCESVLGEFLQSIHDHPTEADLSSMINLLIVHAQSEDPLVLYISFVWMKDFLVLDKRKMLPFASGYLTATLPNLLLDDNGQKKGPYQIARLVNENLLGIIEETDKIDDIFDLKSVMKVLSESLSSPAVHTRTACLKWIHRLYKRMPEKMFPFMEDLFPLLLMLLSEQSDEIVLLVLEVLSDVCGDRPPTDDGTKLTIASMRLTDATQTALKKRSPYFVQFLMSLLEMFKTDHVLLENRGQFIIRQLCVLLGAENIFHALAVLLTHETQSAIFASVMVQLLSSILLTSTETHGLRRKLNSLDSENSVAYLVTLYMCWCHHPVALIALCLLSENYSHAAHLVKLLGEFEVRVDYLVETDKLIQLLESPVFAYMRLQLLDPVVSRDISTCLYGLLMIIPQTKAFRILYKRLKCLPASVAQADDRHRAADSRNQIRKKIPFNDLLKHFHSVQNRQALNRP